MSLSLVREIKLTTEDIFLIEIMMEHLQDSLHEYGPEHTRHFGELEEKFQPRTQMTWEAYLHFLREKYASVDQGQESQS